MKSKDLFKLETHRSELDRSVQLAFFVNRFERATNTQKQPSAHRKEDAMRATGLIALLMSSLFTSPMSVWADDEAPRVKIEFRRAETEPATGLTRFTLPGYPDAFYLHPNAELTNADIAEAAAGLDERGRAVINIAFTAEGAKKMSKLSSSHLQKPLAILIDGKVTSAPRLQSTISERAQVSGVFTRAEARRISDGIMRGIESAN
jgi:hypothetical protein